MAEIRHVWRAGLGGAATAAVVNLAIYTLGRVADVDFALVLKGSATQVGIAHVILVSIGALVAGTALAALLAGRHPNRLGWAQAIGAATAVVTAAGPLTSASNTGTAVLLATMHLVTGAIYVLALQAARRSQPASADRVAVSAAS